MEYLIGAGLALAVCLFAWMAGFDRDRAFYPTVAVVVATYYILFAAMAGSAQAAVSETLVAVGFAALAVVGFRKNFWLVAAALAGHGAFDFIHHMLVQNPGVPVWWPGFCLSFDVIAGVVVGVMLKRRAGFARATLSPLCGTEPQG